ncbi:DUF4139 domain-containing protein [Pontiellaceae bacterium B1224]|nr:DUF4139 domain-containing protein [Pontiellaceae bacterium B1224]
MNHIHADQLRDHKFDLLSETESADIAAHLETCADCLQKFQALEAQFQSLEVLRDQPEVSEERLKAVLVEGRKVGRSKVIPLRPIAILAAAAGLAIAFMLIRPDDPSDGRTAGTAVPTEVSLAELRAEKPFAPASNIELNVLPRRDEVQLTIYNAEDLTLVREKRKLTLKRGWNWLQFMWSNTLIDPTSLELTPVSHAGQIEITQLVFPPRLNELARWTIFSEFSGEVEFELTYFTSGLKWNAHYEATLSPDEQTLQLKSRIRVDNGSGEDYENAQTRLVVGEVNLQDQIAALANRQHAFDRPYVSKGMAWGFAKKDQLGSPFVTTTSGVLSSMGGAPMTLEFAKKEIFKQALSEYQLYTIEGRETIPDGWGKRLPNIEAQEIGVTNLYKFEAERWGNQTMRFLSFANTEACRLGETPLPEGLVRVFGTGRHRSPSGPNDGGALGEHALPLHYIEAANLQYIPVGEQVELVLGAAEKVTVEPKLMRTRTENMEFDAKGNLAGWDEITNWQIEITNTKAIPVEVEIMRWAGSNHWKIETDETVEKYDAQHFRFLETVQPQSKRTIEYELTVQHGTRREE